MHSTGAVDRSLEQYNDCNPKRFDIMLKVRFSEGLQRTVHLSTPTWQLIAMCLRRGINYGSFNADHIKWEKKILSSTIAIGINASPYIEANLDGDPTHNQSPSKGGLLRDFQKFTVGSYFSKL